MTSLQCLPERDSIAPIVKTALSENLALIAITDHNEITNVTSAIKAATGTSLVVVPGVELTTPEGHLLVCFETLDDVAGKCLAVTPDRKRTGPPAWRDLRPCCRVSFTFNSW